MRTLHLPLKGEYFHAIREGTKLEEYRLRTPYWRKRLEGREYDEIHLTNGYPNASQLNHHLRLPWRGYMVRNIIHPHFGPEPVEVYAIRVSATNTETTKDA